MQTKRCFVTVRSLGHSLPVLRPQIPPHQVRSLRNGIIGKPINSAVLANPVSGIHMVGVHLLGEACTDGLLGREEPLLRLRYFPEPPSGLFIRSGHVPHTPLTFLGDYACPPCLVQDLS